MKFVFYTTFSVLMDPPPNYLFMKKMIKTHNLDLQADSTKVKELYIEYLYSQERMNYKFQAFEKITLPSILSNLKCEDSAEWWIYISKDMPTEYKDRLYTLVSISKQIKVVEVESFAEVSQKYIAEYKSLASKEERLCVLRIDDDDGVYSNLFLDIELAAQSRQHPFLFTCPEGKYCKINVDGEIVIGKPILKTTYPHTVALAGIDIDIRKLGDHTKIQKRNPNLEIVKNENPKATVYITCDVDHTATLRKF